MASTGRDGDTIRFARPSHYNHAIRRGCHLQGFRETEQRRSVNDRQAELFGRLFQ